MKINPKIGASCGRIHPTGTGIMQLYQKFEYAIGHWMFKSTEHILGKAENKVDLTLTELKLGIYQDHIDNAQRAGLFTWSVT